MTESTDWNARAEALVQELARVEQAASEARIPYEPLGQMRRGVDHCRTALWAAATAPLGTEYEAAAAVLAARLVRVEEMCHRIVEEIAAGRVWVGTPGLAKFLVSLEATEKFVRPLIEEADSARGAG